MNQLFTFSLTELFPTEILYEINEQMKISFTKDATLIIRRQIEVIGGIRVEKPFVDRYNGQRRILAHADFYEEHLINIGRILYEHHHLPVEEVMANIFIEYSS
jgi:hypothetical protein